MLVCWWAAAPKPLLGRSASHPNHKPTEPKQLNAALRVQYLTPMRDTLRQINMGLVLIGSCLGCFNCLDYLRFFVLKIPWLVLFGF